MADQMTLPQMPELREFKLNPSWSVEKRARFLDKAITVIVQKMNNDLPGKGHGKRKYIRFNMQIRIAELTATRGWRTHKVGDLMPVYRKYLPEIYPHG